MTRIDAPADEFDHGQMAELVGRVRWVNRRVYIDVGVLLDQRGAGVAFDMYLLLEPHPVRWVPLAAFEASTDASTRMMRIIDQVGDAEPPPFWLDWLDRFHLDSIEAEAVDVVTLWGQSRAAVEGAGR